MILTWMQLLRSLSLQHFLLKYQSSRRKCSPIDAVNEKPKAPPCVIITQVSSPHVGMALPNFCILCQHLLLYLFASLKVCFLCSIRHPHIATVYGWVSDPASGKTGILTELLPKTLSDLLSNPRVHLTLVKQVDLLKQVAAALVHLHQPGNNVSPTLHGSLRSLNCMVNEAETECKVTDAGLLGVKRLAQSLPHAVMYTLTGPLAAVGGVLPWLAPEHLPTAAGDELKLDALSPKADVYAFGIREYSSVLTSCGACLAH